MIIKTCDNNKPDVLQTLILCDKTTFNKCWKNIKLFQEACEKRFLEIVKILHERRPEEMYFDPNEAYETIYQTELMRGNEEILVWLDNNKGKKHFKLIEKTV